MKKQEKALTLSHYQMIADELTYKYLGVNHDIEEIKLMSIVCGWCDRLNLDDLFKFNSGEYICIFTRSFMEWFSVNCAGSLKRKLNFIELMDLNIKYLLAEDPAISLKDLWKFSIDEYFNSRLN